jgi:hypothetical protein
MQMPHAFTLLELEGDRAIARVTLNEVGRIKPDQRELLGGAEGVNILAVYTDTVIRGTDSRWRYAQRTYKVVLFDGRAPHGDVFAVTG